MVAAAAIWLTEGGPILFRQVRIGRARQQFTLYKLRTMTADSDHAPTAAWTRSDDPRVTRVGRVLRRTHLDELPQLLNVLTGDMSLVGPRPEQAQFVTRLEQRLQFYSRRHFVKPGLTGWAQVRCGYAGSEHGSAWKLCHDLYYLRHRSLTLDLLILAETCRSLFVSSHRQDASLESLGWTVREADRVVRAPVGAEPQPVEVPPAAPSVG